MGFSLGVAAVKRASQGAEWPYNSPFTLKIKRDRVQVLKLQVEELFLIPLVHFLLGTNLTEISQRSCSSHEGNRLKVNAVDGGRK